MNERANGVAGFTYLRSVRVWFKPDPSKQVVETRVVAKWVKLQIQIEPKKIVIPLSKCLFQGGKRSIDVTEAGVDFRGGYLTTPFRRYAGQLVQDCQRLGMLTC